LLAAGWDLAQVSTFLGHANVAIIAAVYMHTREMGDIEDLAEALGA
jgi:integrase